MPAISAWAATWPPKTRCRSVSGLLPRKRSVSRVSMSRSSTSSAVDDGIWPLLALALGTVEAGQELLELPTDLLPRRDRLVLGEQAVALLLGALERVVLLLEGLDHLEHLGVGGEVRRDLLVAGTRGFAQGRQVDREPARELDLLQQRDRRLGEVELGEVVRDVGDEAHRVVTGLAEPQLQQSLRAGRDAQLAAPRAVGGEQVEIVGVVGHRDRPG